MSTVGHAHIVAAEQNRVDDLGTNCRLEQAHAECLMSSLSSRTLARYVLS